LTDSNFRCRERAQLDPELVKSIVVNRVHTVQGFHATPLHLAVKNDDLDMISLLVENGANLDVLGGNHNPPLAYAKSERVAIRLIELGASFGPLYLNHQLFSKLIHHRAIKDHTGSSLDEAIFSRTHAKHSAIYAPVQSLQVESVLLLASSGHDLTRDYGSGRSIMHSLICDATSAGLVLHNRDLGLNKTTPFPWHLSPGPYAGIAFLVTRFRHFRRVLSTEDFARIINLQPDCGYSPLCLAASINRIVIMENCLEMGAIIDFEGSAFGSALMTACIYGNLESVKMLVRRGAQTSYVGESGPVNVMKRTQSITIRQWLLVGRFNEQKRIIPAEHGTSNDRSDCIRPWSGITKARLKLNGSREMQPYESYFDYAKELARIRKNMRGMIVPDFVGASEAYRKGSN
jgi:ankyrin repeat protein